jgi:hypothetical protein
VLITQHLIEIVHRHGHTRSEFPWTAVLAIMLESSVVTVELINANKKPCIRNKIVQVKQCMRALTG